MNIWQEAQGKEHIKAISGTLFRMVESQEHIATSGYVDTLAEQAVLEELLESCKPPYPDTAAEDLHYLLKTPFRYPPLLWGSRFGRVHEPSLFYGGESLDATLAEAAYYRFVFLFAMEGTPPTSRLKTQHTVFTVSYETPNGVALQEPPFDAYQAQLTDPYHYEDAQTLGTAMREAGVSAFKYTSARAKPEAICAALFDTSPFTCSSPLTMEPWLCEATQETVVFKSVAMPKIFHFSLSEFLVEDQFPLPA